MQPLPHQGRGLLGIGRQVRREFDLDARPVQLMTRTPAGACTGMTAVGDDEHIGGRRRDGDRAARRTVQRPARRPGAPRDGRKVEK